MISRTIPIILLAAIPLTGCGEVLNVLLGGKNIRPNSSGLESGIKWLRLEDPACEKTGTTVTLSSITIYEWDGKKTNAKKVSLNGGPSDDQGFSSTNIFGSVLDVETAEKCTVSSDGTENCTESTTGKESGSGPLKICRSNGTYGRDSLESVALTAQYFAEQSYVFYDSITGRKDNIRKAYVLPQIKIRKDKVMPDGRVITTYDQDNAAFSGSSDDQAVSIWVYPTSWETFKSSGNNLWESPFVMHHEFGHHALDHYIATASKQIGVKSKLRTMRHQSIIRSDSTRPSVLSLTDDVIASEAIAGIHEAFADLFAYFQGDGVADQPKGLYTLDTSRDPSSPKTRAGSSKGLDTNRIDIYERRTEADTTVTDPYEPLYNDSHDIAVALGYPLAKFIKESGVTPTAAVYGSLLLRWADRMNTVILKGASEVTTDTLVRELIIAGKNAPGNINSACANLKPLITGLPLSTAACAE